MNTEMKTVAGRGPRLALTWTTLILLFNAGLLVYLMTKPGGSSRVATVDNIAQFLGPLLALPLAIPLSRRVRGRLGWAHEGHGRQWVVPLFLGLGALFFALGQIVWAWYELVLHQPTPFPSIADVGFLLSYPFMTIAVLLFPRRPLSFAIRARVALDGLLTVAALVTLSWYFILGPTVMQGGEGWLGRVVGTAYPVWDLILIACLIVMYPHLGGRGRLMPALTLAVGLGFTVVADVLFDYGTIHNTYTTGALLDVGWPLGYMVICLAAYLFRKAWHADALHEAEDVHAVGNKNWTAFVPYLLVPPVCILLIYVNHVGADPALRTGVEAGSIAVVACVLLRQVLSIVENGRLSRRLGQKYVELEDANRRLQALATTDPHTGLPNHRAIIDHLDVEIERACRYSRPCSLLFIDVDHFKAVNDGLGHSAGDAVLTEVVDVFRAHLRSIDVLGRWGGEEFIALLPEAGMEEAMHVAERLRSSLALHVFSVAGAFRLTCSVGIACFPHDAGDRDGLVETADRAMYAAKRLGRNRARASADAASGGQGHDMLPDLPDHGAPGGIVAALSALVDGLDHDAGRHSVMVADLCVKVASSMGMDEVQSRVVGQCGRLHDLGKVAIPQALLRKPTWLTTDELAVVRTHAVVGAEVLERIPALSPLAPVVRAHHERWDGRGYPDGLEGEAIPVGARIVGVADSFTAMTSQRPYRSQMNRREARAELRRCAGTQFDPAVVRALEEVLDGEESLVDLEAS